MSNGTICKTVVSFKGHLHSPVQSITRVKSQRGLSLQPDLVGKSQSNCGKGSIYLIKISFGQCN